MESFSTRATSGILSCKLSKKNQRLATFAADNSNIRFAFYLQTPFILRCQQPVIVHLWQHTLDELQVHLQYGNLFALLHNNCSSVAQHLCRLLLKRAIVLVRRWASIAIFLVITFAWIALLKTVRWLTAGCFGKRVMRWYGHIVGGPGGRKITVRRLISDASSCCTHYFLFIRNKIRLFATGFRAILIFNLLCTKIAALFWSTPNACWSDTEQKRTKNNVYKQWADVEWFRAVEFAEGKCCRLASNVCNYEMSTIRGEVRCFAACFGREEKNIGQEQELFWLFGIFFKLWNIGSVTELV